MFASKPRWLLAGVLSLILWPAYATEAPVHDCDLLAADPLDNKRVSPGIYLNQIDPDRAISVCEAAIREFPETPRFKIQYARSLIRNGDTDTALGLFQNLAEQGNAVAQTNLGWLYDYGIGVGQNYAESLRWYRIAVEQGNPMAQTNLGLMHDAGKGVPQDFAEAAHWFRMAAEQGEAIAQLNLGSMYLTGQGVPQDFAEALKWFQAASDQGFASAQNNLGVLYLNGQGVTQDIAEALKWFRIAAEHGDASAQNNLGVMYDSGQGVPQDFAEAARWFRMAADQGEAFAQFNLGVMYQDGQGVPQDVAEAERWYRMAAEQGLAGAQEKLDSMIGAQDGYGVSLSFHGRQGSFIVLIFLVFAVVIFRELFSSRSAALMELPLSSRILVRLVRAAGLIFLTIIFYGIGYVILFIGSAVLSMGAWDITGVAALLLSLAPILTAHYVLSLCFGGMRDRSTDFRGVYEN